MGATIVAMYGATGGRNPRLIVGPRVPDEAMEMTDQPAPDLESGADDADENHEIIDMVRLHEARDWARQQRRQRAAITPVIPRFLNEYLIEYMLRAQLYGRKPTKNLLIIESLCLFYAAHPLPEILPFPSEQAANDAKT